MRLPTTTSWTQIIADTRIYGVYRKIDDWCIEPYIQLLQVATHDVDEGPVCGLVTPAFGNEAATSTLYTGNFVPNGLSWDANFKVPKP